MNEKQRTILDQTLTKDYGNIAGITVLKNGKLVYENYFNTCNSSSKIHVYSVTKSIISLLIGIAIDKGYIKNINQKIIEFFPDYKIKKKEQTLKDITLRDILTMTAPYKYKFAPYTYIKYFMSDDWVTFSLDLLGGKGKIGDFKYTPIVGLDILSGILIRTTGQSVFEFATENVFSPLDIHVKESIILHSAKEQATFNKSTSTSGWVTDSAGVNAGGWGLTLSSADMAKVGQLYLNKGVWDNKQIVSTQWIMDSTTEHSKWDKMDLSYGYLWWIIDKNKGACAAMGDGGNIIYFNPQNQLVVAISSMFVQRAKDRIELIKQNIEPLFDDYN